MYTHVSRGMNARTARRFAIGLLLEVWLGLKVRMSVMTEAEAENEKAARE